jgi:hypothetical protein
LAVVIASIFLWVAVGNICKEMAVSLIIQDKSELYMIKFGLGQIEEILVKGTLECKAYYLEFLGFNIHLLLYEVKFSARVK